MQNDRTPVVCRACKRTVLMRDIKFDDTIKAYICTDCYNKTRKGVGIIMPKKEVKKEEPFTAENLLKKMVKYNCPKCKYHFQRPENKEVKECPYCGFKAVERANKDAAHKILEESDGWD